ncbi:MAG: hypothetical protein M3270_00040 [Thermoproteota archaeon]|nr:hypothetical protein [Thermoproteota archaeon]
MSEEQQQLIEIEVRKWDAHSFTIDGVNDQLEKIRKRAENDSDSCFEAQW